MTALAGVFVLLSFAAQASTIGVLVLAHGGSGHWNQVVMGCVREAHLSWPTEVVFGMGDADPRPYQAAIRNLRSRGVQKIVTVPLLISSHSEVYRQYEFLLRLRPTPGFGGASRPVLPLQLEVPVVLIPTLDSSPLITEVLLERALEISRVPQRETLILVAHGPNDDKDNAQWEQSLEEWGKALKVQAGFRGVRCVTLRDDAPDPLRQEATTHLRKFVAEAGEQGGAAIIVPVLLAPGGIERGISKRLKGLSFKMGRPLLPHAKLSQWIHDQVEQATLKSG